MKLALILPAVIFAGGALAQGSAPPYVAPLAAITQRAPTASDDASKGYTAGSVWQFGGVVYQAVSVTIGAAVWVPQIAGQYPAYAAPTARSFNGAGLAAQQRVVDILGSAAKFAGGTVAMRSGYAGPSIDVLTTVAAAPVTTTINIAKDGLLDIAALNTALAAADVGTSAYVTKLYDQTGTGNHLTKHASYPGPLIGARSWNGIPEMSWGGAQGETGLVIPATFTAAGNNFSAFMLGEMMNATGANASVFEIGNSSGAGPSFAIVAPSSVASTRTGLWLFAKGMGTPSPSLPAMFAPMTGQVFGFVSNAGAATVFSNENYVSISWNSSQTMVGGNLGRIASAAGYSGMMNIFGFILTNSAPTSDQITRIKRGAYALYNFTPQIQDQFFTIGDSRTQGYQTNVGNSWPTQIAPMLNAVRPIRVINEGVGGQTALKVSTDAAAVLPTYKVAGARTVISIGPIGTNDITQGRTAAEAFSYLQAACAAATVPGVTTIAINELPRNDGLNSTIAQYRALFNAGPTGCTYSIDPAGNVTELSNAANTTYYPDGLHLSDAGEGLLATYIARTVAPLLAR